MAHASVLELTVRVEPSTRKLQVSAQGKMPQLFRVTVEPSVIEMLVGTKSARSAYSVLSALDAVDTAFTLLPEIAMFPYADCIASPLLEQFTVEPVISISFDE